MTVFRITYTEALGAILARLNHKCQCMENCQLFHQNTKAVKRLFMGAAIAISLSKDLFKE